MVNFGTPGKAEPGPSLTFVFLSHCSLEYVIEAGIVKYKMSEGLPNTQICPLNLGSKERQLRNSDLFMTYVIVAAGFVVSATIFISEMLFNYFVYKKEEANPKFSDSIRAPDMAVEPAKKEKLFQISKKVLKNKQKEAAKEDEAYQQLPPPPSYHALFRPPFAYSPNGVRKTINGTEYWVVKGRDGETRLIPVRSPSAFLYTFTN